jgi:hypothetical protein
MRISKAGCDTTAEIIFFAASPGPGRAEQHEKILTLLKTGLRG